MCREESEVWRGNAMPGGRYRVGLGPIIFRGSTRATGTKAPTFGWPENCIPADKRVFGRLPAYSFSDAHATLLACMRPAKKASNSIM